MSDNSDTLPHGTLRTRREFLGNSLLGAATTYSVPLFMQNTFMTMNAAAEGTDTQISTGKDDTILVVLQLAGGNDGLNTLVPFGDDAYYEARPALAIAKDDTLKLNDHLGFAPQLAGMKGLYDSGDLAVVQGIGYPNPNRSHFRSTEIWQTATDANGTSTTGWLGRYFDHACAGSDPDPTVGVSVSKKQPQSFGAKKNPGISLSAPEFYRWLQGKHPDEMAEDVFRDLNQPDENEEMTGASIDEIAGKGGGRDGENVLDFLERTALDAQVSSDKIMEIARRHKGKTRYPGNKLAQSLSLVSRMIAGGLQSRVYYVSHGGFDTHRQQGNSHPRLLTDLDSSLKAFFKDLKEQGNYKRVTVMTFSEFGRRVKENASGGTDHGAAAPLFVAGGGVKGGLYGKHPSLADLNRGDLKFTTDFRNVYATMLDKWLKSPSKAVLGQQFEALKFMG